MKRTATFIKLILFLLLSCSTYLVLAQSKSSNVVSEAVTKQEAVPAFKGGQEALDRHFAKFLKPLQTTDLPDNDVTLTLKFTLNPDGNVSDVVAVQMGGNRRKPKDTGNTENSKQRLDAELAKGKRLLEAATAAIQETNGQWVLSTRNKTAVTLALHAAQIGNEAPTYELKPYIDPKANKVYKQAAQMPTYKGGQDALMLAINRHLQVPEKAKKEKLLARVIVSLIVEKDGTLSNVRLLDAKYKKMFGAGEELDYMDATTFNIQNKTILADLSEAAIHALRATSGAWEPGTEQEKPVRVELLLPFSFTSSDPVHAKLESAEHPASEKPITESQLDKPYTYVEEMPRYKEGVEALKDFIQANLATANKKEGQVFLNFIVEKDGQLSNFEIAKSLSPAHDAEALRVLRLTRSDWQPGKQGGVPVRVKFTVPVRFKLDGTK